MKGELFNSRRFWKWVCYAMVEGIMLCYFTLYQNNTYNTEGMTQNLWSIGKIIFYLGSIVYTEVILIANFRLFLSTFSYTIFSVFLLFLSIFLYFSVFLILSNFKDFQIYNNSVILFNSPDFYLSIFQIVGFCLFLDFGSIAILKSIKNSRKVATEEITLKSNEKPHPDYNPDDAYLMSNVCKLILILDTGSAFCTEPNQSPHIAHKFINFR